MSRRNHPGLRLIVSLLDVAVFVLLGIGSLVVLAGGFTLDLGLVTVRAHDALRPLLQGAGLLALRRWLSGSLPPGIREVVASWRRASPAQQSAVLLALAAATVLVMLSPVAWGGLTADYYSNANWSGSPSLTRRDRTLDIGRQPYARHFSIEWTGVIHVPREWTYRFQLQSDDAAWLWIDHRVVAGTAGESSHSPETLVELSEGFHDIRIRYRQLEGEASFTTSWRAVEPDRTEQPELLPLTHASLFVREPPDTLLRLTRAGASLARAWWVVLGMFALAMLFIWSRPVEGQARRSRPTMAAVQSLVSDAVELALVATVAWLFWMALDGTGDAGMNRTALTARYLTPLTALALLFVARRLSRGAVLGGFRLSRPAVTAGQSFAEFLRPRMAAGLRPWVAAIAALTVGGAVLASAVSWSAAGLRADYYDEPTWSGDLIVTTRDRELTLKRPIFDFVNPDYLYSVTWTGVIGIDEPGDYEFAVDADGPAGLWIDQGLVAARGGPEAAAGQVGVRRLDAGFHSITVRYAPAGRDGQRFSAAWRRLSTQTREPFRPLSSGLLFPETPSATVVAWSTVARMSAALAGWLLTLALVVICTTGCHWALASRPSIAPLREPHVALLLATSVGYVALAIWPVRPLWGFHQLGRLPTDQVLALAAVAVTAIMAWRRHGSRAIRAAEAFSRHVNAHAAWLVLLAAGGAVMFFLLRSENVNADGIAFRWMIPTTAASGEGINFDEMWETYLRSRFWLFTNTWFGWSVRVSYQVVSSMAGGVFLVVLWAYARRVVPAAAPAFWLLMLSGGYVQLFFGDVEHYTLSTVGIVGYFLASAGFIQGAWSLVAPSAALAVAMSLHMVAGFLAPSLVVLHLIELRRRAFGPVLLGTAVFASIIAGSVVVLGVRFDGEASWGIKALQKLALAAAAPAAESGAGSHWRWIAFDQYHLDQYNLLALMFPGHILAVALALGGRIRLDRLNVHLIVATLSMLTFHFNYLGLLGALGDWNLFAPASIPLAILVWRNLLEAEELPYKAEIVIGWGALSFAHTMAWVVSNHRYAP